MPKMVHFGDFLKPISLRSKSITRHVNFNRTKIGVKSQNANWTPVAFEFFNLNIFNRFCPIKIELSGNIVSAQASGFQKLAKMDHFWHF